MTDPTDPDTSPDTSPDPATASAARRRWMLVLVALVVAVVCLATAGTLFVTRSAGDGLGERVGSLAGNEVPQADEVEERETLLSAARTFVLRFNTYGPEMLDDTGRLPDYAAVADLMTPTFATVFDKNVGYAEQTVAELGAERSAEVLAVGVASADPDSAEVLVAGRATSSFPYPDEADQQTSDDEQQGDSDDDPRVSSGPQRFRYRVFLVKVEGEWLVDNIDDIDDGLPPFADPVPEDSQVPGLPDPAPSDQSDQSDQPGGNQGGAGNGGGGGGRQ